MNLPIGTAVLIAVSSFFLYADSAKAKESGPKDVTVPASSNEATNPQLSSSEDTSPRFLVKELRITGNTLVTTDELLEKLPATYTVSGPKGDISLDEVYDFRVLHEIINQPGQEHQVSQKTIKGLTQYLLSVYQDKGYAGIYVYVPAKAVKGGAELEGGILPIHILEGKVANIAIRRYDFDRQEQEDGFLKGSILESWSPVQEGQVIQKTKLDNFLRLLNLNPDRYVSAAISRSDKPDALNVNYDVYETDPWHWYTQVDNAGSEDRRWSPRVGVVNTNLTGIDDRFSLTYQAKPDSIEENYAVFGSYELPLFSPRLRLGFFAGYTEFDVTPDTGPGIDFLGNGWFYGSTLRYNVFQLKDWMFDFIGSVSHEESKLTPSLGLKADVETNLYGIGAEIHRSSDLVNTSISFNRLDSFGGSSKSEFQEARTDTDPDFTIYTASLSHRQFMAKDKIHELTGTFRGIFPDERLIPARMTPFGGLYSVRGYEEDRIVADGGIIASLQYRFDLTRYNSPTPQLGQKKSKELWPPNISLLAFTDYGQAKIKDPVPGEEGTENLWGAGVGTLVELGSNFNAAVYCAWPLTDVEGTDKGDARLNFSIIGRW